MSESAQIIARYAEVKKRLWQPITIAPRATPRVVLRLGQRHPSDDIWHYDRPIGPRRVIYVAKDKFQSRIDDMTPVETMRPSKKRQHKLVLRIIGETATEYGMTLEALFGEARFEPFPTVRAIAIHRCISAGCSYLGIGRALGRDHTTIRHAAITRGADGKRLSPRKGSGGG